MNVGDLVMLKKWCRDRGRLAHVMSIELARYVVIQFLDEEGLKQEPIVANRGNVEVVQK